MKPHYLFPLVLLLALASITFARGTSYPGRASARSPHKTYEIRRILDKDHEGAYTLFLRNTKTKTTRNIFSGDRHTEVLWQKNESHLAITDWECSNSATIYIANPADTSPAKRLDSLIDLTTIHATVTPDELQGHCYWEALLWTRTGKLHFRIFGHTDSNPSHEFSYIFRANLTSRAVTLTKK